MSAVGIVPGLLVAVVVALAARTTHAALPAEWSAGVSELLLAILLGLLLGHLAPRPSWLERGVSFAQQTVLRTAIVLLGLRFSLEQVGSLGGRALLMVAVLMVFALAVAHTLGRRLGIAPRLATLIGVGTAVCGNSAISAAAPVIGARQEEVSYAIAANTLFGTLAVFAYPLLGAALGLSSADFGTWAGAAVNDTSQVVATGFAFDARAGAVATAVKLTRNALLGLVIVAVGWLHGRSATGGDWRRRLRQSVPLFVVGFLLLATLNSLGWVETASRLTGRDLYAAARSLSGMLILVAMGGVGLGTRLRSLRALGAAGLGMGLATALTVSLLSLLWIRLLGGASG